MSFMCHGSPYVSDDGASEVLTLKMSRQFSLSEYVMFVSHIFLNTVNSPKYVNNSSRLGNLVNQWMILYAENTTNTYIL